MRVVNCTMYKINVITFYQCRLKATECNVFNELDVQAEFSPVLFFVKLSRKKAASRISRLVTEIAAFGLEARCVDRNAR